MTNATSFSTVSGRSLKLPRASESGCGSYDSGKCGRRGRPGMVISNKLPGDVHAAGLTLTSGEKLI